MVITRKFSPVRSGMYSIRVPFQRAGHQPLNLPPMGYAMDPSDPRTWRRPVVFT